MAKAYAFLTAPKGQRQTVRDIPMDTEAIEAAKDAQDLAEVQEREKARLAGDKLLAVARQKNMKQLSQILERPYVAGWSFPWLGKMLQTKKWMRFQVSRFYMADKIVIDLFATNEAYKAADVTLRRRLCLDHGLRYGALNRNTNLADIIPQIFGDV